jgi:hypothetical protein
MFFPEFKVGDWMLISTNDSSVFREIKSIEEIDGDTIYTFKEKLYNVYKGVVEEIIINEIHRASKTKMINYMILSYDFVEKVDDIDEALKLEKLRCIK